MIDERVESIKVAVKTFLATFALIYFILAGILIVQYLTTQTSTRDFWDSVSFTSDIVGILALLFSTVLWIVGFRPLSYDDTVRAAREGVIDSPEFQGLYNRVRDRDSNLIDEPDIEFTDNLTKQTAFHLEALSFTQSIDDFRSVDNLLGQGLLEEAVFRIRRGLELFLRELCIRSGLGDKQKIGSRKTIRTIGQMVLLLSKKMIIDANETALLTEFAQYANGVVHGTWKPDANETMRLISGLMSIINDIARSARKRGAVRMDSASAEDEIGW